MIPLPVKGEDVAYNVPRTRGDDPYLVNMVRNELQCSPHTRG